MKKNGFTLIELIISIALVGIILASMIGTLISLKDTYGVINEDVEARTYSALVSKVINEHLMKNNGIKNYSCAENMCSLTLGNNKEMILEIVESDVKTSDIDDSSSGDRIGTLLEQVTTVKYYEVGGGYSYYKTLKHYDRVYDDSDDEVELGYKFERLSQNGKIYNSKKNPDLKDYLINITIEMNNPKYNIELYSASLVDKDELNHKYRLYTLTYNSNGGKSCIPGIKTVRDSHAWGELCVPERDGYGFKGWFIQPSGHNVQEVTSETVAKESLIVYAHWDSSNYSCPAGTYLKAGETTCTDCPSDHYCPSLPSATYNGSRDQGIFECLAGYHSEPKSTSASACKITCEENTYLKNANDSFCTSCPQGFLRGGHDVIQGQTSTCAAVPPSKPTISGGGTKIYGSSNFSLTCSTPSTYGSETNIYYQFGYASSSNETISSWSTASTTNTYTVSSTAYVENRYYACRVYVGSGNESSAVESDKTLVTINNATLTFDATTNGGTLSGTTPLYTKKGIAGLYTGISNTTAASAPTASKAGYSFDGWYTSPAGGSRVYNSTPTLQASVNGYTDSSSKWTITENKTLYAQFVPGSYTVTYNCNGGSGVPSSQTGMYGSSFTINTSLCSTPKTGHTQNWWNEKADGTGTAWSSNNRTNWTWNYTNDVTLYAQWSPNTYVLTANAAEGTIPATSGWTLGSGNKTATKSVNYGSTYGTLPTPTRTNYVFDGWYTSSSGGSVVTSSSTMGTSDTSIHAHWTLIAHTLTISAGSNSAITVNRTSSNYGGATGALSNGATIYTGDVLKITYSASTGYSVGTHTVNGSTFTSGSNYTVSGNTTVVSTANINSYTLTANAGDGTIPATSGWTIASGSKTATKSVNYNATYGTLPTPTRANYRFDGWYTAASGGSAVSSSTKMGTSNTTIYAHWTLIAYSLTVSAGSNSTITVNRTSSPNGGSTGNLSNGATIYTNDVLNITFSASTGYSVETHTVNGSTFTSGNTHTVSGDVSVASTATANSYTVTYNCNGGEGSAPSSGTGTYNSTFTVPTNNLSSCYKIIAGTSGAVYYQSGWSSTTGGSEETSITITGNMVLYAVWKQLFTYDGSYNVISEGSGNWRIEFKTIGTKTLTVKKAFNADIHAVGGGGGGSGTSLKNYSAGGGGGGYTSTAKNKSLSATTYSIIVGDGGAGGAGKQDPGKPGTAGDASKFGSLVTANGGKGGTAPARWSTGAGGAGGSGGGSGSAGLGYSYGTGGSNGSSGGNGEIGHNQGYGATCCQGGAGQGTTTRDFGETSGTLRAGGGGGGVGKVSNPTEYAAGGNGGGGRGGRFGTAGANGDNYYGGGGGGGSHTNNETAISSGAGGKGGCGIVIMRNAR